MDQHICLFYLADKLTVPKLQEFYQRMCSALNYDEQKFNSYYLLYNSQYHLFSDIKLTESRKKTLSKIAACNNCHSICKKNIYKSYHIEDNACILCRLSTMYRNARIADESMVLRRMVEPNTPFKDVFINPSLAFNSVIRIGKDYAIGSYPIIQLNAYVYEFLRISGGYGDNTRESFLDKFVLFIMSKVETATNTSTHMDVEEFKKLIDQQMLRIYGIDLASVSNDVFEKNVDILQEMYVYLAPLPTMKASPVNVEPETKSKEKPSTVANGQLTLLDALAPVEKNNLVDDEVSESDLDNTKTPSNIHTGEIQSDSMSDDNQECPVSLNEPDMYNGGTYIDPFEIPEPLEIPDYAFQDDENEDELSHNENEPISDYPQEFSEPELPDIPEEYLYDDTDVSSNITDQEPSTNTATSKDESFESSEFPEIFSDIQEGIPLKEENAEFENPPKTIIDTKSEEKDTPQVDSYIFKIEDASKTKKEPYTDSILSSCILLDPQGTYKDAIRVLQSDASFAFSSEVIQSDYICIAPAVRYNRHGFMIYVPHNDTVYFYDVYIYGTDTLDSLTCDINRKVYSMHTLACLDILYRYHSTSTDICPLDLIVAKTNGIASYDKLWDYLNWNGVTVDHMKSYPLLYEQHAPKLSDEDLKNLRKVMIQYSVLCRSDNLSMINERLTDNIIVNSLWNFSFRYKPNTEIHLPGLIYILQFPDGSVGNSLADDSFFSTVILTLDALPHYHRIRTILLAIDQEKVFLFYKGNIEEGRQFYDLYLSRIQSMYRKKYKKPLKSDSYCYEYVPK